MVGTGTTNMRHNKYCNNISTGTRRPYSLTGMTQICHLYPITSTFIPLGINELRVDPHSCLWRSLAQVQNIMSVTDMNANIMVHLTPQASR